MLEYRLFPSFPGTRRIAEVFRRTFLFPSGVSVDRQVRHGGVSGGAVRQDTFGTLPEVPVPRNITSMSFSEDVAPFIVKSKQIGVVKRIIEMAKQVDLPPTRLLYPDACGSYQRKIRITPVRRCRRFCDNSSATSPR
jgi:hypothetical protein